MMWKPEYPALLLGAPLSDENAWLSLFSHVWDELTDGVGDTAWSSALAFYALDKYPERNPAEVAQELWRQPAAERAFVYNPATDSMDDLEGGAAVPA